MKLSSFEEFLEKFDTPLGDKKEIAKEIASTTFSKPGELVKLADLIPFYKGESDEVGIPLSKDSATKNTWRGSRIWAKQFDSSQNRHLKHKNLDFKIGDFVYWNGDKNNVYRLSKIQSPWRHTIRQYSADLNDYSNKDRYGCPTSVKKNVIICEKFGNVTKQFSSGKSQYYSWGFFDIHQKFFVGNVELDHVLSFRAEKKKMTNIKTCPLFINDGYPYNAVKNPALKTTIEKVDILDMCMKRDEYLRNADKMTNVINAAAELAKNITK